ncbi:MAG: ATP-binding cassette domain-containing protein [Candidatus Aenigmarchaeota archaeon]|nr:ATP-binding cassette domain-containing protein [Candidatus Aenigmarchaeota archaeon]
MGITISVRDVKKRFGQKEVFQDVSFRVRKGEIVALFGPNGCGKSTLLNILSRLVEKDGGKCDVDGFSSSRVSYVFQNYRDSLLPWRNVYDNVAFPLELQDMNADDIRKRVQEVESILGVRLDRRKYPYELSGGQQQMLAFARALVTRPQVFFIDEPFSALDYENNLLLRKRLQEYCVIHRPTVLVVTHDIEEAVHLAGRIVVLSKPPARVVDVVENPSAYPRDLSFLDSKQYRDVKGRVFAAFQKGAGL